MLTSHLLLGLSWVNISWHTCHAIILYAFHVAKILAIYSVHHSLQHFTTIQQQFYIMCTNIVVLTMQYPTMPSYFIIRSKYWINTTEIQNFPKIYAQPQHFRCQRGDWRQVPYSRPTYIRHHHSKFNHPGNLAPRICTPLQYSKK